MASRRGARGARAGAGRGEQGRPALGEPTAMTRGVPPVAFAPLGPNAVQVTRSVTIRRSRAELFELLSGPGVAARLLKGDPRVELVPGTAERARLQVRGWLGLKLAGEAEIVAVVPDQLIAWHSPPDVGVPNTGMITLVEAPGHRGTEVHVVFAYRLRGGVLGRLVGKLIWPAPAALVRGALRRLQQLVEVGEIATIEGQPSGREPLVMGGRR